MKLLDVIDVKLLGAYQAVVNLFQRKREWWVEQCAYLMAVLFALMWGASEKGWLETIGLFGGLLYAMTTFYEARLPVYFERLRAAVNFRHYLLVFFLACWAFDFAVLTFAPEEVDGIGRLLVSWIGRIALLSPSYFAACEPPAPPRKREQKKLEFAA